MHLVSIDQRLVLVAQAGHDNPSPFKMYDWQADNQLAGKSLSHNADIGLSLQIAAQIFDNSNYVLVQIFLKPYLFRKWIA